MPDHTLPLSHAGTKNILKFRIARLNGLFIHTINYLTKVLDFLSLEIIIQVSHQEMRQTREGVKR